MSVYACELHEFNYTWCNFNFQLFLCLHLFSVSKFVLHLSSYLIIIFNRFHWTAKKNSPRYFS